MYLLYFIHRQKTFPQLRPHFPSVVPAEPNQPPTVCIRLSPSLTSFIFSSSSLYFFSIPSLFILSPTRTLKKIKKNFPHILGNRGIGFTKSYMNNDLVIYGEKYLCISSYMTLHPILSEFSYI